MTTDWLVNELLTDVHTLAFPEESLNDAATLELIVYDAETVEEVGRQQFDLLPLRDEQ